MSVAQCSSRALPRFQRPGAASALNRSLTYKFATPASIATSNYRVQTRTSATTPIPQTEAYHILEKQRLRRPVAPHLAIYRPQVTWYLSGLNRITGCVLSGGFYIFGSLYLLGPIVGINISSIGMAKAFGAWPVAAKVATKFMIALPFTFHSFNGIRHLVWDTGREFANRSVIRTGWFVVGLTFVTSGILAYV